MEPEKAPGFSFANMLPPVAADNDADSAQPNKHVAPAVPPQHADMPADRQQSADAVSRSGAEPGPTGITGQSSSDDAAQQQAAMLQHLSDAPSSSLSLPSRTAQCPVPDRPSAPAPESPANAQQLAAATEAAETVHSWLPERHVQQGVSFWNMLPQPEEQHSMSGSPACMSLPCELSTHSVCNHGADSCSQPGELSVPGTTAQIRQPPAEESSAASMFSNVLPQPGEQQSTPSDVGVSQDVLLDEQHSKHNAAAMFLNVLPQPDEQDSEDGVSAEQPVAGMSRREQFRQKLAQAAQAGQAESQAAAPPNASEAESTPARSIQWGAERPVRTESEAAAATADIPASPVSTNWNLHGSPAQHSPGTSPEAASCGDKNPGDGRPSSGVSEPALNAAASSPERPTAWPGIDGTGSSGERNDVSVLPEEASSRTGSEVEAVTPGKAGTPDEAAANGDAEVHWAENAAAGASEEPDEALLHAIRRMSAVARERIRSNADKAPAQEAPDLATSLPQSAALAGEPSEHPCSPTCDPKRLGRDSQPGTEQRGQGMGSPVRASYEQLLARFYGSPATSDACASPPRGSANQENAQQGPGEKSYVPTLAFLIASKDSVGRPKSQPLHTSKAKPMQSGWLHGWKKQIPRRTEGNHASATSRASYPACKCQLIQHPAWPSQEAQH